MKNNLEFWISAINEMFRDIVFFPGRTEPTFVVQTLKINGISSYFAAQYFMSYRCAKKISFMHTEHITDVVKKE